MNTMAMSSSNEMIDITDECPKEYTEDKPVMVMRNGVMVDVAAHNKAISKGKWQAKKTRK